MTLDLFASTFNYTAYSDADLHEYHADFVEMGWFYVPTSLTGRHVACLPNLDVYDTGKHIVIAKNNVAVKFAK